MGVCCSSRENTRPKAKVNVKAVSQKSQAALDKQKAKSLAMERQMYEIIQKGQPWTDPEFPPERKSLYDPKVDLEADPSTYNKFTWKRASDIYNPLFIFEDGVEPNDINQGQLGDCYFLAALSSLAEFPERVKAMFVTQQVNKAGIYMVRFFLNGQETPILVDEHLPCAANGKPAFATCRDGELWVSILEKAWAKLHGTYARTEGGLPCFAASHIMGVPSESHQHDQIENTEEFFDMLQSADKRNFTMMAASHGQGENRNDEGVISGHAYSMISIHEIQHKGKELKLLKLRNPWGSGEWKGDWSDKSPTWTPQLKQQVGFTDGDDGIFFIELEDYLQHFSWTSVCVDSDPTKYTHSQLYHSFGSLDESPMPQAFFSFTLTKPIDFNKYAFAISVLQQGERLTNYRQKDERKAFQASQFNIVLMTERGEFVNARFGSRFTFSLLNGKTMLKPGKYIFMIDPLWNVTIDNDDMYREVLVDIYAPEAVNLDQVEDVKGMQYLEKALKHAAKTLTPEESKQYYLEDNEDYGSDVIRISDVECLNCWYGFIYTQNNSPHKLTETMRPTLEGLEVIYPPMVDEQDIEFSVEPGKDHIVILRRNENSCKYGLQYMTHPRELTDEEMMIMARNVDDDERNYFDESAAFYKLYNTAQCAVFYFENGESNRTLQTRFEMQIENLYIQGEPEGVTEFSVELPPGKSGYKILKPIQEGEATGIQMRYEFGFK